jgi:hypothetical protein
VQQRRTDHGLADAGIGAGDVEAAHHASRNRAIRRSA